MLMTGGQTGFHAGIMTGLDYFGARYMSAAQGRFTSPDLPLIDQDPADPQSWNLYSYVRNNPLRFIDPTGQTCQTSGGLTYDDMDGQGCAAVDADNARGVRNDASRTNPAVQGNTVSHSLLMGALVEGIQRAEGPVNAAGVGTAVVASGGLAGIGYGAVAGGTGLTQLGIAAGPAAYSLLLEIGRKLDYLFGLAQGSLHNIQRSTSMLQGLRRIGLNDTAQARSYVQAHLGQVLNDAGNIVSQTGGRTVRESFLMGPAGGVKLETVWEGTKLITMKVLGGGK